MSTFLTLRRRWIAAALFYPAAVCSAPAAPVPARQPNTRTAAVDEIKLSLRRIEVTERAMLRLDRAGKAAGPSRKNQEARLEVRLTSRYPASLSALRKGPIDVPSGFRAVDNLGKESRQVIARVDHEEDGPVLFLTVQGLSFGATSLRVLEGSLLLFPQAKMVRFHIPWSKDDVPFTTESTGAVATLGRFQLVEEDSTLWISVRPPAGLQVAPFELPGTVEARAYDRYGNLVNNGGITRIEELESGLEPHYRFSAPGMRGTPARLTLDVLCVSGTPVPRRFRLRDVDLPARR